MTWVVSCEKIHKHTPVKLLHDFNAVSVMYHAQCALCMMHILIISFSQPPCRIEKRCNVVHVPLQSLPAGYNKLLEGHDATFCRAASQEQMFSRAPCLPARIRLHLHHETHLLLHLLLCLLLLSADRPDLDYTSCDHLRLVPMLKGLHRPLMKASYLLHTKTYHRVDIVFKVFF